MRITFLFLFFMSGTGLLSAQNKILDYAATISWPYISNQKISNDGKFVMYFIGTENGFKELVVKSIGTSWNMKFKGAVNEGYFTDDSKHLIFQKGPMADTLGIQELGNSKFEYISDVSSFKIPDDGNGKWLAVQQKNSRHDLILIDLFRNVKKQFSNIDYFTFNSKGTVLLTQNSCVVKWTDLVNDKEIIISNEASPFNFVFNEQGTNLVFFAKSPIEDIPHTVLKYYCAGMDSAHIIVNVGTRGMERMQLTNENLSFNKKGNKIFFRIEKRNDLGKLNGTGPIPEVTIWNYNDENLLSNQLHPINAAINLPDVDKVVQLEPIDDQNIFQSSKKHIKIKADDRYNFIIEQSHSTVNSSEYSWRKSGIPERYLVSTIDGTRILLKKGLVTSYFEFSLDRKYIIWYDKLKKNWFTYNLATGVTKNITRDIHVPVYEDEDRPDLPECEGLAGWLNSDYAVLIYDQYDIWQVDPAGNKPPINITHSYGRLNRTKLRFLDFKSNFYGFDIDNSAPISLGDTLILSAFNLVNKWNGFFSLQLDNKLMLTKLIMEPKIYYFPYPYYLAPDFPSATNTVFPVKAKYANCWLFKCMSSGEYPNLSVTSDFKSFKPLTNMSPQKEYNWYKTELIQWKLPDGKLAEGILYKPKNFNPKKKYPVIFYYYEQQAFALNIFINPALFNGVINIPWLVSRDYLVFVPDIYYKKGYPGKSACNSVVSAAKYLCQKPWINKHRMGLQGHSFGGFETNYIVSHSHVFAAAAPAAGTTDLIRAYNHTNRGDNRYQWFYEKRQGRIGFTLWERPDLYIQNSAVFYADKVSAPILILHNKGDGSVEFGQESEWYSALTRLNKKVWLLSYDHEGHTIDSEKNQLDYTIRLTQFFDHYLKGAPAPRWMTEGRIATDKGYDYGLQLDTSEKQP